jgi:hypothetical protein
VNFFFFFFLRRYNFREVLDFSRNFFHFRTVNTTRKVRKETAVCALYDIVQYKHVEQNLGLWILSKAKALRQEQIKYFFF